MIITNFYNNHFDSLFKKQPNSFAFIKKKQCLELINGDFLNFDWEESSLVFANSTCFSNELMTKMSKKADTLKKGTFLITFTKCLPDLSSDWKIREPFKKEMSWGIATVFVHRKIK